MRGFAAGQIPRMGIEGKSATLLTLPQSDYLTWNGGGQPLWMLLFCVGSGKVPWLSIWMKQSVPRL